MKGFGSCLGSANLIFKSLCSKLLLKLVPSNSPGQYARKLFKGFAQKVQHTMPKLQHKTLVCLNMNETFMGEGEGNFDKHSSLMNGLKKFIFRTHKVDSHI